jgi:hypothetical protein
MEQNCGGEEKVRTHWADDRDDRGVAMAPG